MCNLRFRQVSPTISSVRRTADCLCAHDSVDVVMGSDFTRYCARLVIRIARSPSPVQRAAVSSYDFVVYVTIIQIVNIHNKVVNATKDGHAPDGVSDSSPQNRTYDAVPYATHPHRRRTTIARIPALPRRMPRRAPRRYWQWVVKGMVEVRFLAFGCGRNRLFCAKTSL